MAKTFNRKLLTCKRCGYRWLPRVYNPLTCPYCRSPFWNRSRRPGKK